MQARHHQYLDAMGIQVWKLRDSEPVAEPDVELEAESVEPGVLPETSETAAMPVVSPAPEKLVTSDKGELESAPPGDIPQAQFQPEPLPNDDAQVAANPEFRLASIVFPDSAMLVTQVPVGNEPMHPQQLHLLQQLLLAMGLNITEPPNTTFFNWPMLRSPGFDQSSAAACQASQAFVNGQKTKYSVPFILLMGEDTGRFLLPDFQSFSSNRGRLYLETAQPLLLTHSLHELFSQAELKAAVWRDIQPLRLHLSS